jgi:membrane protease YdiL (CAAX protease family)
VAEPPPKAIAPRTPLGDGPLLAVVLFVVGTIAVVVTAIGVAVVAVAIAAAGGRRDHDELIAAAATPAALLATIVATQAVLGGITLLGWWATGAPFRQRLGLVAPRVSRLEGAVLLAGAGVPFALALAAASLMPALGAADGITDLWSQASLPMAVAWTLVIALLPGLGEELFYRGLLQPAFARRLAPWAAILLTSVLFALMHVDPPAMGLAFVLGLWLGVLAWRTGSVLLAVATHMLVNGGWNLGQFAIRQELVSERAAVVIIAALGAISVAAFAWSVLILRRTPDGIRPAVP